MISSLGPLGIVIFVQGLTDLKVFFEVSFPTKKDEETRKFIFFFPGKLTK